MTVVNDVSVPSLRLSNFMRRYGLLRDKLRRFENARLNAELLIGMASRLADGAQGVRIERLTASCRYLVGQTLTMEHLSKLALRLAGRFEELNHDAVTPWQFQREAEWVLLRIQASEPERQRERFGTGLSLAALSGECCSERLRVFWTRKRTQYVARLLGFDGPFVKRKQRLPYQHPRQLTQLAFFGLVTPELSLGRPRFNAVHVTGQLRTINRRLTSDRYRYTAECPQGFKYDCHLCAVGYNDCPYGTHPKTYEIRRVCMKCKTLKVYVDPERQGMCVGCADRGCSLQAGDSPESSPLQKESEDVEEEADLETDEDHADD